MERQITDEEWSEFINLVVKVLEGHQDPTFIETVALRLSEDVHNQLREWKTRLEGSNANCAKQTRYVLKTWKSLQTQLDLDFLVHEFDQRLSTEKLANELRTKVVTRFNNRKNGNVCEGRKRTSSHMDDGANNLEAPIPSVSSKFMKTNK